MHDPSYLLTASINAPGFGRSAMLTKIGLNVCSASVQFFRILAISSIVFSKRSKKSEIAPFDKVAHSGLLTGAMLTGGAKKPFAQCSGIVFELMSLAISLMDSGAMSAFSDAN